MMEYDPVTKTYMPFGTLKTAAAGECLLPSSQGCVKQSAGLTTEYSLKSSIHLKMQISLRLLITKDRAVGDIQ